MYDATAQRIEEASDQLAQAVLEMRRLAAIEHGDRESNGCEADRILGCYLRASGATEMADAYEDVETWRG